MFKSKVVAVPKSNNNCLTRQAVTMLIVVKVEGKDDILWI